MDHHHRTEHAQSNQTHTARHDDGDDEYSSLINIILMLLLDGNFKILQIIYMILFLHAHTNPILMEAFRASNSYL